MCLVALFFQVFDDAPLVAGANREEAYARGGEPPRILDGPLRTVAGVDPVAGGTWLGVNWRGVLIAVTNRPKANRLANPRSRGLLARDLLLCPTAQGALNLAGTELKGGDWAGCNVVCADREYAAVIEAGDRYRGRQLRPGLHLLTANDMDDSADARQEFARAWLTRRPMTSSQECVTALQQLCGLTGDAPMCLRHAEGGTVSSAVIALRRQPERSTYLHAQGPPDITPYEDYSGLLRSILAAGERGD